jgi:hypothetical protein
VGTWQLPVYLPLCVFISSLTAVGRVLLHGQRRPACAQAPVNVATIAVSVLELVPSVLPPLLVQVPAPLPPIRLSAAVAASAGPVRDRPAAILVAVNSSRSASVRPAQAPPAVLVQLRPPGGGCTGFVCNYEWNLSTLFESNAQVYPGFDMSQQPLGMCRSMKTSCD